MREMRNEKLGVARAEPTCGTCLHRDSQGQCAERRSAFFDWRVGAERRVCYFYEQRPVQLPLIGGGLEGPADDRADGGKSPWEGEQ